MAASDNVALPAAPSVGRAQAEPRKEFDNTSINLPHEGPERFRVLMRQHHCTLVLLAASASIFVASCAQQAVTRPASPGASLFAQEAKPIPDPAILPNDDGKGARRHPRDKDDWGQRGWDRANDLCLWFEGQGMDGLPCQPAQKRAP